MLIVCKFLFEGKDEEDIAECKMSKKEIKYVRTVVRNEKARLVVVIMTLHLKMF